MTAPQGLPDRGGWLGPELIIRLELLRFFTPLAILGFLSSRIAYADQWISENGFCLPEVGAHDAHQSAYFPPIPSWAAWAVSLCLVVLGVLVAVGYKTRPSAACFSLLLGYVALADRLAAFTVNRIAPVMILAICLSPAGERFSVDAWLERRRHGSEEDWRPAHFSTGGVIRFFQCFLVVFYTASGICKIRGDWLKRPDVLWTHLHDSYQTYFSFLLANSLPAFSWTVFQGVTLIFECGAVVWLAHPKLRPIGLALGVGMHLLIGLMFGPVIWFSLLMISVLLPCFLPDSVVERLTWKLALWTRL